MQKDMYGLMEFPCHNIYLDLSLPFKSLGTPMEVTEGPDKLLHNINDNNFEIVT